MCKELSSRIYSLTHTHAVRFPRPYSQLQGDSVVRTCIQNDTDYIDVCAEPAHLARISHLFGAEATARGVLVLAAAGSQGVRCLFSFIRAFWLVKFCAGKGYSWQRCAHFPVRVGGSVWETAALRAAC